MRMELALAELRSDDDAARASTDYRMIRARALRLGVGSIVKRAQELLRGVTAN